MVRRSGFLGCQNLIFKVCREVGWWGGGGLADPLRGLWAVQVPRFRASRCPATILIEEMRLYSSLRLINIYIPDVTTASLSLGNK